MPLGVPFRARFRPLKARGPEFPQVMEVGAGSGLTATACTTPDAQRLATRTSERRIVLFVGGEERKVQTVFRRRPEMEETTIIYAVLDGEI